MRTEHQPSADRPGPAAPAIAARPTGDPETDNTDCGNRKQPPPAGKEWLSPAELAAWLGVPKTVVYHWNTQGIAPRRARFGKHIRYRRRDVERWIADHQIEQQPTA